MDLSRRTCLHWLAGVGAVAPNLAQIAVAQPRKGGWPSQTVNLIVPFPAGGPSAILGKYLAQAFERTTQQNLRLVHQGGAGGFQGANFAAKAPADGQNLFIGSSHLAIARALTSADEFDLIEDLRPLALIADVPQVVVVNPQRIRSRTATEWMAELTRKSVRYRMATAGVGSSSHISAEILKLHDAVRFELVHFRGAGPAVQDLLAGSVDMMMDALVSCLPHIRSGRLKALMVTGSQRSEVLPDVPCAQELGMNDFDRVTWYGLFAPHQLAHKQALVIEGVLRKIGEDEQLNAQLAALGVRWGGVYGDAFAAMVQQDTMAWAQRVKSMGLKPWGVKGSEDD